MRAESDRSLADADPVPLWLDDPAQPEALPALAEHTTADLVVVGGGYTGLWTALRAKQRRPELDVVLLEAGRCGSEASGRNGGFCAASLTHGFRNGLVRWPDELADLDRIGAANLAAIGETIKENGIDCGWELTGDLVVATAPHQVEELTELAELLQQKGHKVDLLDADATRREVRSPTYLAGLWDRTGYALVEPARLAWGLRAACEGLGVRIHEGSRVLRLDDDSPQVGAVTGAGSVRADKVALATNAFPPALRRLRLMTVPVYDYVLATEPLSPSQLASIGWQNRQGVGDSGNLFHYYRLTRDNRIVWGGYDALYHYGSRIDRSLERRTTTHEMLAQHFFTTFPQLTGLRFSHRWAGVIDTSTRFTAFFGTALRGRVAYALGYTGLGVAATRFGAEVMLDRLWNEETERTRLRMVAERPLPFPPEPLRFAGIQLTRWSLARADQRGGRRNLWLRGLDRLGLGFDS